ncbi:MAG: GNAT family N-acetyltransferase [Burkholderiales bacterium]
MFEANLRPDGRVRCLHTEHGPSAQTHADEMLALPEDEALFLAAHDAQGGWLGAIGAAFDPALRRAWVRGPLLAPSAAVPAALQRALIDALLEALPAVDCFDTFAQADETPLLEVFAGASFEDRLINHVLCAQRPPQPPAWPASVVDTAELDDRGAAAARAAQLHAQAFPTGHLTPQTLLDSRDDDHHLFVGRAGEAVMGYVYLQHDRHEGDAYIDFLAVDADARRRGVGRALLDAALHWAFVERKLERVNLTVRSDRAPALALYHGAGFVEVAAGRHLRMERSAPHGQPLSP